MGSEHPENIVNIPNSELLNQSYLIEAFNLKAAIEYTLKNFSAAKEAMKDMPPREDIDLDPITLHNMAVTHLDDDMEGSFEKLRFLIAQNLPPETLHNILIFYLKHQFYDVAADLYAQYSEVANNLLDPFVQRFVETIIIWQVAPEECFKRLDEISAEVTEQLRSLSKEIQTARQMADEEKLKALISQFDDAVDQLLPVVLFQAKIRWDSRDYAAVEKVLKKPIEFCNDHDSWRLNVAHVFFMQEKFKDAISFYEPMVKDHYSNVSVPLLLL